MFGSTRAERQAAANLRDALAAGGTAGNSADRAAMTDESINRQVNAARQLNEAAGGDLSRIAGAIGDARQSR